MSFAADLVSVTAASIAEAVAWLRAINSQQFQSTPSNSQLNRRSQSSVNNVAVCDTLNKALKLASVRIGQSCM